MIKKYITYLDFHRLQEEVNQLLEELTRLGPDIATWTSGAWHPCVDIFETKDEVVITVEVPGVRGSDIGVTLKHNVLMIAGRKFEEGPAEHNIQFLCLERSYGEFRRAVPLTAIVDPQNGSAILRDGILTLRLKKIADTRKSEYRIKINDETETES
jgi:HSP20 family protein